MLYPGTGPSQPIGQRYFLYFQELFGKLPKKQYFRVLRLIWKSNSVIIKFHWNSATWICFCIVYSCFHATRAECLQQRSCGLQKQLTLCRKKWANPCSRPTKPPLLPFVQGKHYWFKKKKKKATVQLCTYIWMIYQLLSNDKLSSISPSISVYSMRLPGFKTFQNIVLDIVHGTKKVLINM